MTSKYTKTSVRYMKSLSLRFLANLLLTISSLSVVYGQSATATFRGNVLDEQGARIIGATVKISEPTRSFERVVITVDAGSFMFTSLAPSNYSFTVEQTGFGLSRSNIVLNVNDQSAVSLVLKIATADAFVTVDQPLINETPVVSTVINRQFVENQPLNGRSFQKTG